MSNYSLAPHKTTSIDTTLTSKKKYSKVNETLRIRFIDFIVQNNMSIKEASIALNINYSSAKAILAHHRKNFISTNKLANKHARRAEFRLLSAEDTYLDPIEQFICSTGGKEVGRSLSQKHRPIFMAPIILQGGNKDLNYLQNTSEPV